MMCAVLCKRGLCYGTGTVRYAQGIIRWEGSGAREKNRVRYTGMHRITP